MARCSQCARADMVPCTKRMRKALCATVALTLARLCPTERLFFLLLAQHVARNTACVMTCHDMHRSLSGRGCV